MDEASESNRHIRTLQRGMDQCDVAVLHQGLDLVYTTVDNLPEAWPVQELIGETDAVLPPELAALVTPIKLEILEGRGQARVELALPSHGGRALFELVSTPDRDASGAFRGIITTIADITDQRDREAALASLLRELSHRSNNLLAIVQSVAMQTAFHAGNIDDFLEKFRGRLYALAASQDLVTANNWRGTHFQSLVLAQLAKGHAGLDPIHIGGDDPMLGPNAALHIGLAIHELVTNATLHGALSGFRPGRIEVAAEVDIPGSGAPELTITWTESRLPQGDESTPPRFGTLVLEKIVPRSLGGTASFDVQPDRVRYRLSVPGDQFMV